MLRDDSFGLSTREAYLPSTTGAKPWVLGCRSSGILPENGRNLFNLTEPEYDSRVPAGEVPADLPGGPAPVIREASLQARRHFTLADQVNQLVAASEADPETGFISRMLALCSQSRTNPGNRIQYKRRNGPYTPYMTAGGDNNLPFGTPAHLLMVWLCIEWIPWPILAMIATSTPYPTLSFMPWISRALSVSLMRIVLSMLKSSLVSSRTLSTAEKTLKLSKCHNSTIYVTASYKAGYTVFEAAHRIVFCGHSPDARISSDSPLTLLGSR